MTYMTTSSLYQGVQPIYISLGVPLVIKWGFVDGWGYCPSCFKDMEAYVSPDMKELEEQMRTTRYEGSKRKGGYERGYSPKYKSDKVRRSNSLTEKRDGEQKM